MKNCRTIVSNLVLTWCCNNMLQNLFQQKTLWVAFDINLSKPSVCHTKGSDVWAQRLDIDDGLSDPGQDALVPASQPAPEVFTDGEEEPSKHVETAMALFDPEDISLSKNKFTVSNKALKTILNPLSPVGPCGYGRSFGCLCSRPCQC